LILAVRAKHSTADQREARNLPILSCNKAKSPLRRREQRPKEALKPAYARTERVPICRLYNDLATMPSKLNPDLTTAAIDRFQEQKKRIDAQIAELRQM
jgi:hypothetical protein